MFVSLKNNTYVVNVTQVMWIKWIESKNLCLMKLLDGTEDWFNSKEDFETVMKAVTNKKDNSNDLKPTEPTYPTRTTRRRITSSQHARDYHKPADIPATGYLDNPHPFVKDKDSIDLCLCGQNRASSIHIVLPTDVK